MPSLRPRLVQVKTITKSSTGIIKPKQKPAVVLKNITQTFVAQDEDVTTVIEYPSTAQQRNEYVNIKTGKKVTPFQYKVYDLVRQIPAGQVTSYKVLSDTLKSAPRAVGQALKINPFCPLPVACHRVIASDLSLGGFSGASGNSLLTANKKAKLIREGCMFEENYVFKCNKEGSTDFFRSFSL